VHGKKYLSKGKKISLIIDVGSGNNSTKHEKA
jgi:hypothetical protein